MQPLSHGHIPEMGSGPGDSKIKKEGQPDINKALPNNISQKTHTYENLSELGKGSELSKITLTSEELKVEVLKLPFVSIKNEKQLAWAAITQNIANEAMQKFVKEDLKRNQNSG